MQCEFCGTELNAGFSTCKSCGAHLTTIQSGRGCAEVIGNLIGLLGALIIAAGVITIVQVRDGRLLGLLVIAAGGGVMWLGVRATRIGRYKKVWTRPHD